MVGGTGTNNGRKVTIIQKVIATGLKTSCCTQDIEVVVAAAFACAVRCQAAVSASVGHLGPKDLEKTAVRQNLVVTVSRQHLSILQPSDLRHRVAWGG